MRKLKILVRLNDLRKEELLKIVYNALLEAWQNEVVDTGMKEQVLEYTDRSNWLGNKVDEWR